MSKPASQRVNAFVLADKYLKALGWPSTPTTRRVLAAWFMSESPRVSGSSTDIYVRGNNPLNITCRTCSNYWLSGGGSHKVVIFPSETAGIQAYKSLISGGGPGYSNIVRAFNTQPNNGTALVSSINQSGWVTGKTNSYINSSGNFLARVYNSLGNQDIPAGGTGTGTSKDPQNTDICAWGGLVCFPNGKIITEADVNTIIAKLDAADFWNTIPGSNPTGTPLDKVGQTLARNTLRDTLMVTLVGKPWNDANIKASGSSIHKAADEANSGPSIVLNVFGGIAGKAVAVGALFVGVGLFGFGLYLVTKDIYNGSGSQMLDVTPIILKGDV